MPHGRALSTTAVDRGIVDFVAAKKKTSAIETVDDYIAAQPKQNQRLLRRVRTIIRQAIPDAEECISYAIPTYKVGGRAALYFAGWKKHFSIYPVNEATVARLADTLVRADYEVEKGTIRIAYQGTMPTHFIQRVARLRAEETLAKTAKKATTTRAKKFTKKKWVSATSTKRSSR